MTIACPIAHEILFMQIHDFQSYLKIIDTDENRTQIHWNDLYPVGGNPLKF